MKKLLWAPALAILLLTSCDNDPELEAPQISAIELSKEKVAVGQLIILSSTVTDPDTDTTDLTFDWKVTDGFRSEEKEAEWVPSKTGKQTITLTVDDGNATATQDKQVEVVEPDFRLGLWGDTEEDIRLSEEYAENELLGDDGDLLIYMSEEPNAIDAYLIEADELVQAITIFSPVNNGSDLNAFITDYEDRVEDLTGTYGAPDDEIVEWTSVEAEAAYANKPEQWGQAIAAEDLFLATLWQISETTIVALILQGDGEGGILSGLLYFPVDGGRYAGELRKGNISQQLETFSAKFKGIRSLQK